MKNTLLRLLPLLFLCSSLLAQDVAVEVPTIQLPKITRPVTVTPAPAPISTSDVPVLAPNQIYVVQSTVELMAFSVPEGLVTTTHDEGPIRYKGVFIDNPSGETETRSMPGPFLTSIDVAKGAKGRVTLFLVPKGVSDTKSVVRILLDIGAAPQPPPDVKPDEPDVPVEPDKPVVVVPDGFRVIIVSESGADISAGLTNVLNSSEVVNYLNAKCVKGSNGKPEWRKWDPDIDIRSETPTMVETWKTVKPLLQALPEVAISVNGKSEIWPLPDSVPAIMALLEKYGGKL